MAEEGLTRGLVDEARACGEAGKKAFRLLREFERKLTEARKQRDRFVLASRSERLRKKGK